MKTFKQNNKAALNGGSIYRTLFTRRLTAALRQIITKARSTTIPLAFDAFCAEFFEEMVLSNRLEKKGIHRIVGILR